MSIGPLVRAMYDPSANVNPENQNQPSALLTLTQIFFLTEVSAKEAWVNVKRAVKGRIRMELRIRKVDKGGEGNECAQGRSLRWVRRAHRWQTQGPGRF